MFESAPEVRLRKLKSMVKEFRLNTAELDNLVDDLVLEVHELEKELQHGPTSSGS